MSPKKYMVYKQDNSLLGEFKGLVNAISPSEAKKQAISKFGGSCMYMIFPETNIDESWI